MTDLDQRTNNLWKARNRIKQKARANFVEGDKFVTLTFNNRNKFDITDISACNKRFSLFIRRLAREFKDLKYITVLEFQQRGAVHYHVLCNISYIHKPKLQEMWGHGFVQINQVKSTDHIVKYISKYMMKYADDPRFIGRRRYFCSTKLLGPKKLGLYESQSLLRKIRNKNINPDSWNRYFSRFHGLIATEVYNLEKLSTDEEQS